MLYAITHLNEAGNTAAEWHAILFGVCTPYYKEAFVEEHFAKYVLPEYHYYKIGLRIRDGITVAAIITGIILWRKYESKKKNTNS